MPNRTNRGQCSPGYCAGSKRDDTDKLRAAAKTMKKTVIEKALKEATDEAIDKLVPATTPEAELVKSAAKASKINEVERMGNALGRLAALEAYLPIPAGLTGEAAEQWMDQRLGELGPKAVRVLQKHLELGDDAQQERAANRILDSLGRGKRDNGAGGSAPIIILSGDAVINPPWKKARLNNETIDAEVTPVEKKDA